MLRILSIGNSQTEDAFQFMTDVAKALDVEQVEVAYCWIGDSTLEQHTDVSQIKEYFAQNYMKKEDFARCTVESVVNTLANPWSVMPSQYAAPASQ